MSSNVGLSTPRGSGTSGYVQRNLSLLKPRDSGYGSTSSYGPPGFDDGKDTFKQRQPDRKILEHDRRREIEVKVLEERDRLEEENERIEEEEAKGNGDKGDDGKREKKERVKLSEEEIEERLDALRARLTKELEDELAGRPAVPTGPRRDGYSKRKQGYDDQDSGPKGRKQFKSYQVHELAEAKIQESERLRRALGIREDEDDSPRDDRRRYDRGGDRYRERDRDDRYDDRDRRYRDRDDDYDDRDRRYRDRGDDYDDRDRTYRDRDDPGDRDGIEEYRRRF